jgi:hypothetical protein
VVAFTRPVCVAAGVAAAVVAAGAAVVAAAVVAAGVVGAGVADVWGDVHPAKAKAIIRTIPRIPTREDLLRMKTTPDNGYVVVLPPPHLNLLKSSKILMLIHDRQENTGN